MYDGPSQAAVGMREPTPTERAIGDLEQLNRRLDNFAQSFGAIADSWHGPRPRTVSDERAMHTAHVPAPATPPVVGRLAQLEQLLRVAHINAQAIEDQLDRLRAL